MVVSCIIMAAIAKLPRYWKLFCAIAAVGWKIISKPAALSLIVIISWIKMSWRCAGCYLLLFMTHRGRKAVVILADIFSIENSTSRQFIGIKRPLTVAVTMKAAVLFRWIVMVIRPVFSYVFVIIAWENWIAPGSITKKQGSISLTPRPIWIINVFLLTLPLCSNELLNTTVHILK